MSDSGLARLLGAEASQEDTVSDSGLARLLGAEASQEDRAGDFERLKPRSTSSERGQQRQRKQSSARVDDTVSDSALAEELGTEEAQEDRCEKLKRRSESESPVCEKCGMTFEHRQRMMSKHRHCGLCARRKVCHLCGKSAKRLGIHLAPYAGKKNRVIQE